MSILKVNGKEQELNDTLSVSGLIKLNNVSQPDMVSIQLNGNFVIRENYESTLLKEGDEIDFLYFMGGGSL
jgi:sulfur carrier protein